jgi:tetratricopeptide (TPR) repeat protein
MQWKLLFFITCLALENAPSTVMAGIFEGNHPAVEKGHQAFNSGKYKDALSAYQQAEKELPESPEIKFNVGNAYMSLGQLEKAKNAYESALSNAGNELKAKDYYNLGNAFAALQQNENAISAYRQALKADPQLEPARHNLEVMLRKQKQPPPSENQPSPNQSPNQSKDQPEAEQPPSDSSSNSAQNSPDDNNKQQKEKDSAKNETLPDPPSPKESDHNQPAPEDSPSPDNPPPMSSGEERSSSNLSSEPISRREAQRLLDAIRRNEKQFLMPQHNRKVTPSVPPEKDW